MKTKMTVFTMMMMVILISVKDDYEDGVNNDNCEYNGLTIMMVFMMMMVVMLVFMKSM